ncbi:MAG: hypothetical protein IPH12_05395 [Saprospirales bacterium]|nr:hypothetical protein [Saprospirales bacterium]
MHRRRLSWTGPATVNGVVDPGFLFPALPVSDPILRSDEPYFRRWCHDAIPGGTNNYPLILERPGRHSTLLNS